jgi:hypothetical protein
MKIFTVTQYAKKKKLTREAVRLQIISKKLKARKVGNQYLITSK